MERVQRVDVHERIRGRVPPALVARVSKKPPEGVRQLAELPAKTKFIRKLGNGASLIECSHPKDYRLRIKVGPRKGTPFCGLCRGEDLLRSCITVVYVAEPEKEKAEREQRKPKPKPEQEALF